MLAEIILFVGTVFELWILAYLLKLERIGCNCALDFRRHFIMFHLLFSICASIYLFMYKEEASINIPFIILINILGVIYAFTVFSYVKHLEKGKCKCSEDIRGLVLKITSIIMMVLYIYVGIMIMFVIIKFGFGAAAKAVSNQPTKASNKSSKTLK